ncbi:MAG TPA: hypothetical protein VFG69_14860, partial [Nannocystaceae bacterium]|nr:hypothetical protein [Nannocystaceae bacterium]
WEALPSGEVRVTQTRGAARYDAPRGEPVAVRTPFGVATFDDAAATIAVGLSDGVEATVVDVHRGVVTLASAHEIVTVAAGTRGVLPSPEVAPRFAARAAPSVDRDEPTELAPRPPVHEPADTAAAPAIRAKRSAAPEPPARPDAAAVVEPLETVPPAVREDPKPAPPAPAPAPAPATDSRFTVDTKPSTRHSVRCESAGESYDIFMQGSYSLELESTAKPVTCTVRLRSRGSLSYELRTPRGTRSGRLDRRTRKAVLRL